MPRRASLIMSIGFVVALVFVTGISASGAQEGGVKAKEAEVAAAQDRLMDIRMETSAAEAAYNNALYEMNQLNGQIAAATEDLDAAKKRLAEAQAELEERASQVYKSGNVAFMDVLVGVDDFSEFATRLDLWVRLLGEERAKVEAVEEAKEELAARKKDLEEQRTQRVDAVDKAISQKERAEEAEKEAEKYLGSLNAELREALQDKQDRQAEMALAVAEEIKKQDIPAPKADEPAPIPEVQVAEIKQVPVEQPDLQDEQAAADRAAAAEAAAAEAERLAEQRAAERQAAREAAEQAAAEQAAAEKAAEREARQDAKAAAEREAELAAQRAAERRAAREAAEREAEIAAQRAAAERAAAQQAADEREAARIAAQRRAERQAAAEAAAEAQAAQEAQASASAAAAQEETTGGRPAQDASASASAAPVGGGGASGSGTSVIGEGQQYLGTPYVLGGMESCVPYEMMDCSCFTMTVYSAFGIALPDSPGGQMGYGTPVSGAPMAGDLLFWSEDGSGYITHVGIAMGDGTAIHASTYTGNVTQGTPIDSIPGYAGARRLL
jgi:cell wall-associated NlpC family hydrolase